MTHPTHPLCGREFQLVDYRSTWGEDRVYYVDEEGVLKRLPASWTDFLDPDPFVVIAAGRSCFRWDDLVQLADLLVGLKGAQLRNGL